MCDSGTSVTANVDVDVVVTAALVFHARRFICEREKECAHLRERLKLFWICTRNVVPVS